MNSISFLLEGMNVDDVIATKRRKSIRTVVTRSLLVLDADFNDSGIENEHNRIDCDKMYAILFAFERRKMSIREKWMWPCISSIIRITVSSLSPGETPFSGTQQQQNQALLLYCSIFHMDSTSQTYRYYWY